MTVTNELRVGFTVVRMQHFWPDAVKGDETRLCVLLAYIF